MARGDSLGRYGNRDIKEERPDNVGRASRTRLFRGATPLTDNQKCYPNIRSGKDQKKESRNEHPPDGDWNMQDVLI